MSLLKKPAQSKAANILFAYEFNRRYASHGITANCLHPGIIKTGMNDFHLAILVRFTDFKEIGRSLPLFSGRKYSYCIKSAVLSFLSTPFVKTVAQGAATTGNACYFSFYNASSICCHN